MANLSNSVNFFTDSSLIIRIKDKEYTVDWSIYSYIDFNNGFKSYVPLPVKYIIRGVTFNGLPFDTTKEIVEFMRNFWLTSSQKVRNIVSEELFSFMLICNTQRKGQINFLNK